MKREIQPRVFWFIASIALFLGVLSRFLFLEDKAFHHDESLHAYYSNRVASGHPHEYSALLHGPFLYYFTGIIMWIFGSSDFSARSASAIFSVLIIASPLLVTKWLGKATTLILMFALLLSPNFMYFGRFLREDAFVSVWVMGIVFSGYAYWQSRKPIYFYLVSAFLAFHFVNKENSFLHVFIWCLALGIIWFFSRKLQTEAGSLNDDEAHVHSVVVQGGGADVPTPKAQIGRGVLWLNAGSIFITIFILFYSSFFRHSKGSWHGVLDGLYRESLLYWWDQNQKRRIDGPFDYHLPLIANYEFLVLPFLALAWARTTAQCRKIGSTLVGHASYFWVALVLMLSAFFLPRVSFVQEACSYAEFCVGAASKDAENFLGGIAKALHFAHSRHFLQIMCFLVFGAGGFFGTLKLGRKFEAFVWFWFTGAIGIYSYVGEKVPWLTIYILLPMFIISATEISRIFFPEQERSKSLIESKGIRYFAFIWIALALPFSVYKAIQASFVYPDATQERLVFTQSTPQTKLVRDRWRQAVKENPGTSPRGGATEAAKRLRIGLYGDSSWPFAWYVEEFSAGDFANPSTETAPQLDAMLIDFNRLDEAKNKFLGFNIYELPMRHWWVPGVNPKTSEIFGYFFRKKLYPRLESGAASDTGVGETKVLYLEKPNSPYFMSLPKPTFLTLLFPAER